MEQDNGIKGFIKESGNVSKQISKKNWDKPTKGQQVDKRQSAGILLSAAACRGA